MSKCDICGINPGSIQKSNGVLSCYLCELVRKHKTGEELGIKKWWEFWK